MCIVISHWCCLPKGDPAEIREHCYLSPQLRMNSVTSPHNNYHDLKKYSIELHMVTTYIVPFRSSRLSLRQSGWRLKSPVNGLKRRSYTPRSSSSVSPTQKYFSPKGHIVTVSIQRYFGGGFWISKKIGGHSLFPHSAFPAS